MEPEEISDAELPPPGPALPNLTTKSAFEQQKAQEIIVEQIVGPPEEPPTLDQLAAKLQQSLLEDKVCPKCGERLQNPVQGKARADNQHNEIVLAISLGPIIRLFAEKGIPYSVKIAGNLLILRVKKEG